MKIFVENSALFYYEKNKAYSKEKERQDIYEYGKISN